MTFTPLTPERVSGTPMISLIPTAMPPMTIDEVTALQMAGACPCAMGIYGACGAKGSPRDHDTLQGIAMTWRITWAALMTSDYAVADIPLRASCKRCVMVPAEPVDESVFALCQRCLDEVHPGNDSAAYVALLERYGH